MLIEITVEGGISPAGDLRKGVDITIEIKIFGDPEEQLDGQLGQSHRCVSGQVQLSENFVSSSILNSIMRHRRVRYQ